MARDGTRWGDGIPITPLDAAEHKPEILALLQNPEPIYVRKTEPASLPAESSKETDVNR